MDKETKQIIMGITFLIIIVMIALDAYASCELIISEEDHARSEYYFENKEYCEEFMEEDTCVLSAGGLEDFCDWLFDEDVTNAIQIHDKQSANAKSGPDSGLGLVYCDQPKIYHLRKSGKYSWYWWDHNEKFVRMPFSVLEFGEGRHDFNNDLYLDAEFRFIETGTDYVKLEATALCNKLIMLPRDNYTFFTASRSDNMDVTNASKPILINPKIEARNLEFEELRKNTQKTAPGNDGMLLIVGAFILAVIGIILLMTYYLKKELFG